MVIVRGIRVELSEVKSRIFKALVSGEMKASFGPHSLVQCGLLVGS